MFSSLKRGLQKTREYLNSGFSKLFKGNISQDILEDLEVLLLQADLGITTTEKIIKELSTKLSRSQLMDREAINTALYNILLEILKPCEKPLLLSITSKPLVILLIGINGAGKTTTIAKLAYIYKNLGKNVVLACGDTFRAAAIEQLTTWGNNLNIPVIKQSIGSDPAAVVFDAYDFAVKNQHDILIADTAGRLHTKKNLMDELKKISRILNKIDHTAPHEIMLVLDASIGQNSLNQVKAFNEAMGITGITITKLDGTAKAGIIFSIANTLNIPIRYIGYGEKITDLKVFNAEEFVHALFK